ncbi:MAG TPA: GNAT family N-acetyltransferase [Anaerolineales bacterium]
MNIRYGTPTDANELAEIGARTFYDAYIETTDPDSLQAYIQKAFSPEIQHNELSNPDSIFLIVEVDGRIAGYAYLMLSTKSMQISRIYLLQQYIGKGLMSSIFDEASQRHCDSIWLGVWEKNGKAISFYKKAGFRETGSQPFEFGDKIHEDRIMEIRMDT